jgi:hypothetical protein
MAVTDTAAADEYDAEGQVVGCGTRMSGGSSGAPSRSCDSSWIRTRPIRWPFCQVPKVLTSTAAQPSGVGSMSR